MTNKASIVIICLPFCGSRAGRVQDVSGWSLVLPRACSGVVVRSWWRFAGSRVVGGDGLMTRAGSRLRSLHSVDRRQSFCVGLAADVLVWWARLGGLGFLDPAGHGCSLRPGVGSLALTRDGQVVLSACRQGDQRQPLCDELGGDPEMRVRAWEATRRVQLSWNWR